MSVLTSRQEPIHRHSRQFLPCVAAETGEGLVGIVGHGGRGRGDGRHNGISRVGDDEVLGGEGAVAEKGQLLWRISSSALHSGRLDRSTASSESNGTNSDVGVGVDDEEDKDEDESEEGNVVGERQYAPHPRPAVVELSRRVHSCASVALEPNGDPCGCGGCVRWSGCDELVGSWLGSRWWRLC